LTLTGVRERIAKKRATGVSIPYFEAGLVSARQEGSPSATSPLWPRMAARSSRATCDAPGFVA
jgi:hypothetical protein